LGLLHPLVKFLEVSSWERKDNSVFPVRCFPLPYFQVWKVWGL